MSPRYPLTVLLLEQERDDLRQAAFLARLSLSAFIRRAIRDSLERDRGENVVLVDAVCRALAGDTP